MGHSGLDSQFLHLQAVVSMGMLLFIFPPLSETHVIILLPDFKPLRLLTLFVINIYTCWTSPTAWSLPPVSHLSGFPLVIPIT